MGCSDCYGVVGAVEGDLAEARAGARAANANANANKTIPFQADYARRAGVEGTLHQAAPPAVSPGLGARRLLPDIAYQLAAECL